MAIAKMHDFPIHGKSRIRLSWGRSQGDKQAELIRKVANFLGITYEASAKLCQGQDNMTIKQIASALGGTARRDVGIPGLRDDLAVQQTGAPDSLLGHPGRSPVFGTGSQGLGSEYFPNTQAQSPAVQVSQAHAMPPQNQTPGSGRPPALSTFDLGGPTGLQGPSPYSHVSPSLFAPFASTNPTTTTTAQPATSPYSHPPGLSFSTPLSSNPYSSVHSSQLVSGTQSDRYQLAEFSQGGIKHYSPPGLPPSLQSEGGSLFSPNSAIASESASAAFHGLGDLEDTFSSRLSLGTSGESGSEWEPNFKLYSGDGGDGSTGDSARPRSTIGSSGLQSFAEQLGRSEPTSTSQEDYWASLFGATTPGSLATS
jgi:hypothetical protein